MSVGLHDSSATGTRGTEPFPTESDQQAGSSRHDTFVGRQQELAILRTRIDEAIQGKGSLVLINGEPGIGKTRLLMEAARYAEAREVKVLWGRCWEGEGAPPFWPWRQVIRRIPEGSPPQFVDDGYAIDTRSLLSSYSSPDAATTDRGGYRPEFPQPVPDASSTASFQLFDRLAHAIRAATTTCPTVIVLDDIHDADSDSLSLIEFLSRDLDQAHLSLLCGFRSDYATPGHPLDTHLLPLVRHCSPTRIFLAGLRESEVAQLVLIHTNEDSTTPSLSRDLFRRTGGNPFFVVETCRLKHTTSPLIDASTQELAGTVRALIRQRLERLSSSCVHFLETASILGKDFDLRLLGDMDAVARNPNSEASIEEATRHGLVAPVGPSGIRYTFNHGLLRDYIYADVPPHRRQLLHHAAVTAFRRLYSDDIESVIDTIAHHLFLAGDLVPPQERASCFIRAADHSLGSHAYGQAARHFQRAIDLLQPFDDLSLKCDLLLKLGQSQLGAGHWPQARATFELALATSRRLCSPERMAAAAIGIKGMTRGTLPPDWVAIRALSEALAVIPDSDKISGVRARLLTALSTALYFDRPRSSPAALAEEAAAIATQLDDSTILGDAVEAQIISAYSYDTCEQMLQYADRLLSLGEKTASDDLIFRARIFRYTAFVQQNHPCAFAELTTCTALAESLHHPRYLWQVHLAQGSLALARGDLASATTTCAQIRDRGMRFHDPTSDQHLLMLQFCIYKAQDRCSLLMERLEALVALAPDYPLPRVGLAYVQASQHQYRDADFTLAPVVNNGLQSVSPDGFALMTLCILAECLVFLGDRAWSLELKRRLLPYREQLAIAGWATVFEGAVAHHLAIVSFVRGELEEAYQYAKDAIDINHGASLHLWCARSRTLAATIAHALNYHSEEIQFISHEANSCDVSGFSPFSYGPNCKNSNGSPSVLAVPRSADMQPSKADTVPPQPVNYFVSEGEYWTVCYKGIEVRLKDSKGMRHIYHLLLHTGNQLSSVELVQLSRNNGAYGKLPARVVDRALHGANEAVCDARAIADYRSRLADIRLDLEDPVIQTDVGRMERLQSERFAIEEHLLRNAGIVGARRCSDPNAERARINVKNAISAAVQRMFVANESLGRHLDYSIRTGRFCSYVPQEDTHWRFEVPA